jgi:uncharacterized protein (DUF305 family)
MQADTHQMDRGHYRSLLGMVVLSFIAMYVLMYAMVDRFANAIPNFNQFYMAGLMAAAMARQVAISDTQFLKSMIPHHAAAILMCERAPIRAQEVKELCGNIIASQQPRSLR